MWMVARLGYSVAIFHLFYKHLLRTSCWAYSDEQGQRDPCPHRIYIVVLKMTPKK